MLTPLRLYATNSHAVLAALTMAAPTTPAPSTGPGPQTPAAPVDPRTKLLDDLRRKLVEHSNMEAQLKKGTAAGQRDESMPRFHLFCAPCRAKPWVTPSAAGAPEPGEAVRQDGGRPQGAAERGPDYWRGPEAARRGALYVRSCATPAHSRARAKLVRTRLL